MAVEFLPGHRLTLLDSGAEYFPALLKAIHEAMHDIHLESYIFEDDTTGRAVTGALIDAAQRGVRVRVLVDGFGSPGFHDSLLPALSHAGVEAMIYRPEHSPLKLRRHRLRRLHRKLAMIDGKIAFIGGINIIDDVNTGNPLLPRFDFAVRVEGPVLLNIRQSMLRLWEMATWASLKRRFRPNQAPLRSPADGGNQLAAFLLRDNIRHRRSIENAYLTAIVGARDSILIANAYFLPGRRFRNALIRAARRGVKVTLLLQGQVEYRLLHYATQALYRKLLGAGIRIFEYQQSFLHAKVAVIDGHWATVGSSNIDPFSLLLAREANLVVADSPFAASLGHKLEEAMRERSRELPADHWEKMPWHSRFLRWASYNLIRLAINLTGYGNPR